MTHPRKATVDRARAELRGFLTAWRERHGLTAAERLLLLAELVFSWAGNAVVVERGGEELT
jgi:hypothetical protein